MKRLHFVGISVLFAAAAIAFVLGYYAAGAFVGVSCHALAWVAYRVAAGKATDEAATAITALRLQVQELRGEAQAHAPAIADVSARVQAVMSFLQATQTYTAQRQVGPTGRPVSPLKNPLRNAP